MFDAVNEAHSRYAFRRRRGRLLVKDVFGSEKQEDAMPDVPEVNERECPHTALAPHWQEPGDMGKAELATYTCESCGQTFPYAQAQQFLTKPPAVMTALPREPGPNDEASN
jgi:hypothetical protein